MVSIWHTDDEWLFLLCLYSCEHNIVFLNSVQFLTIFGNGIATGSSISKLEVGKVAKEEFMVRGVDRGWVGRVTVERVLIPLISSYGSFL